MKLTLLLSLLLLTLHGLALRAETEPAQEVEWVMMLGCRHCHFGERTGLTVCKGNCGPAAIKDGKVFLLSGSVLPKDFKKGGKWLFKGTLSADGKSITVKEMTAQAPTPAELNDEQPVLAAPGAKPYTGPVSHSGAGLPTLTTADKTLYTLKPSKSASTATQHALTRIGGGDLTGSFTATGTTYEDDSHQWIIVDTIAATDAKPRPQILLPERHPVKSALLIFFLFVAFATADEKLLVRSAQSGPWSSATTWAGGKVPPAGASVQIRAGHAVTYDLDSTAAIRAVFIAGKLSFAADRNTRLDVGLIKIQAGEDTSEEGFNCDAHLPDPDPSKPRPTLEVGTPDQAIPAKYTALIRLVYFEGMDKQSCPAIVCCGGRMEFHGAEMAHTWVKLGETVKAGATEIPLRDTVTGWKIGDHVFITGTVRQNKRAKTFLASVRLGTQTEERTLKEVRGSAVVLDRPLEFDHEGDGEYRAEVANLSRNVIVESAANGDQRGHTMFHRGSQGAISYAEFRHLGKEGVLGRYSIHFHLVRDTMRGASVIGASVWDSDNRWITIHGTDYLVVRDCVGYQSKGHGFFLEDGTESFNVLDHNLAVQACVAKPLPKQVLPFDHNDGAGFWWANCANTFTRNVAAECDEYGYRFDAVETPELTMTMNVPQPDGTRAMKDIRTIPFVRFEGNEAHCMRRHSFNLGGVDSSLKLSVAGVGSDARHPFIVRDCKAWNVHWCIHSHSPFFMIDGLIAHNSEYGLWRMNYENSALRGVKFDNIAVDQNFAPYKGTRPEETAYPKPLDPVDDLPPTTVITGCSPPQGGVVLVRGVTSDNGDIKRVIVNGLAAKPLRDNYAQWEATVPAAPSGKLEIKAFAEDAAGNIEARPHTIVLQ